MPADLRNTTTSGLAALNRRVTRVADRTYTVPGGRVVSNYIVVADNIDDEAVNSKHIKALSITTEKIEAGSITAEKIAANAVIAEKINANAITTVKLAAESVTAEKIKAGTITAAHIEAGSITTTLLAAESVTAAKIKAGTITATQIAAATITAEKMNVAELSAITADMGDITAGTITGGAFRTAEPGVFPRIDLDTISFRAARDVDNRVNLIRNPVAGAGNTATWTKLGGGALEAVTLAEGENPEASLGLAAAGIFTAFRGTGDGGTDAPYTTFSATTGKTYRLSMWVYIDPASTSKVFVSFWKPGFAGQVANTGALPTGEWVRVTLEGEATSTGNYIFAVGQTEAEKASEFWWTGVMVEEIDPTAEDGGAGFFFPTPHQLETGVAEWSGASHESTSTLTAEQTVVLDTASGLILARGVISSVDGSEIETKHLSGLITDEQIEELDAAKIAGQLTNEQLEAIAAAKITGQITETQITSEAISTAKLKAAAVEASKVAAGAITAEKIATNAVTAEKVNAGAISTTKLAVSAVTAEKIATNAVTAEKIIAGAVTATKINVSELSAITANLGTITAGTITGVTFQTSAANPKVIVDSAGFRATDAAGKNLVNIPSNGSTSELTGKLQAKGIIFSEGAVEGEEGSSIKWIDASSKTQSEIFGIGTGETSNIFLLANRNKNRAAGVSQISAYDSSGKGAGLQIVAAGGGVGATVSVLLEGEQYILANSAKESSFLQLVEAAKRKVNFGEFKITVQAGTDAADVATVNHGLETTPKYVGLIPIAGKSGTVIAPRLAAAPTSTKFEATFAADTNFAAKTEITCYWVAIG